MNRTILTSAAIAVCSVSAFAQSNASSTRKYAWAENLGWLNCRDANGGVQGARLYPRFLAGFIWIENAGWINLGDAQLAVSGQYPPAPAGWGVNIGPDNALSGFAWGENIGWINFGPWPKGRPNDQRVTLNSATGRVAGYAWSEDAGWINFSFTAPPQAVTFCYANCDGSDGSPVLTANDFQCFLNRFAGGDPYANCDASTGAPSLTANDFQCFLNAYAWNCP